MFRAEAGLDAGFREDSSVKKRVGLRFSPEREDTELDMAPRTGGTGCFFGDGAGGDCCLDTDCFAAGFRADGCFIPDCFAAGLRAAGAFCETEDWVGRDAQEKACL